MSDGVQVGTLFAVLTLQKDRFEKGIKQSGGLLHGLGKAALAAGAVIAGAVVGFGIAAAKSAEDQERADDRIRRALGKSGDAFIKWASDNAVALRVTDDHLEDLAATAIASFSSMGFSAGKSTGMVQNLMKRAADISATTGKSFDEVFSALLKGTQGATRGLKGLGIVVDTNAIKQEALRLKIWDGKGALDAGTKAAAIYSLEMKNTANQAGAAAEKQGTMAETMKVIPVLLDKVMDAAGRVFLPIVSAILPAVVGAFEGLASAVEGNVGAIGGAVGGLGTLIGGVFSTIRGVIGPIADVLLPRVAAAFSSIAETVLPVLRGAFETFTTTILPALQGAFGAIVDDVLPALAGAFQAFIDGVLPIVTGAFAFIADEVMPRVASALDFITTTVIPAIGDAINWLATEILPPIMAAFQAIAENVLPILAAAFDMVVGVVRDNWPTISAIAEAVGGVIKGVVDVISGAIQFVAPLIRWLAETIFPILGKAAGVLLGAIKVAFDAIKTIWDAVLAAGKIVVDGLSAAFTGLVGVFRFVGDTIANVFKGALNFLVGLANAIIGAVNGIQIHIGRIGLDTPAGFIGVGPFDWNGLQIPTLRYLERGGIVTSPTLAMIGERNRREAVIPLDDPRVAGLLGGAGTGRVTNNYLTVQGDLRTPDAPAVLTTLQRMAEVTA